MAVRNAPSKKTSSTPTRKSNEVGDKKTTPKNGESKAVRTASKVGTRKTSAKTATSVAAKTLRNTKATKEQKSAAAKILAKSALPTMRMVHPAPVRGMFSFSVIEQIVIDVSSRRKK